MSTKTTNYNLIKPEYTDTPDITAMNVNWDTIDTKLKEASESRTTLENHITNKSNPHEVTAEQIGAVTKEYVDEAIASNVSSGIYVQATEPENPKDGDIWVDLSDETTYIYAEGETF